MKPFGEFFEIMLNSCCAFLGVNNNDFFEFCFKTFHANHESRIRGEMDSLTNNAKHIMSDGLALLLGITGPFDPEFPGLNKTNRYDSSPDGARQGWYRFRRMGYIDRTPTIKENMLIGTIIILCLISTAQDAFAETDERFKNKSFDNNELIAWLCEATNYSNAFYIEKVKTDAQYLLPFLLSSLFYCRKWQTDGDRPSFDIAFWLDSHFNSLLRVSNDVKISEFQKEYYTHLWNVSKTLDIRDMVSGAQLSSISKNAQISNLYIIPPFLRDGEVVDHPIDDRSLFSYLVVANTGCGKSTFLQAIVTSNIYEKVVALQIASLTEDAINRYQLIKERLGFTGDYFPILVKADCINDIGVDELRAKNLLDFAIGSQCNLFAEWIAHLLSQQCDGKVLLLVDALDEIDGSSRKDLFGKMIERFTRDYQDVNIILTSRSIDFRDFHGCRFYDNHIRISLGQFGEEEIQELISKWMQCDVSLAKDSDIEKKYRLFLENEYLSRLAPNPYMLSHALCYQAYHVNATPQEIISHVIDNLIIKRWPVEKYEKLGITTGYMREVLAYIAWNMAYEKEHVIPSSSIISWFCRASEEIDEKEIDRNTWKQVVKEMTARSGLIVLEDINYVFQNEVIEHYLASEWIVSNYSRWSLEYNSEFFVLHKLQDVISDIVDDECWEDILIMMFSPDKNYYRVRFDELTPALLKYLLLKTAETMNPREIMIIGNVFINVVRNTFGKNHITNDVSESGRQARRQITKFLHNYSHIIGDSWKTRPEFLDAYEFLKNNKIINVGG